LNSCRAEINCARVLGDEPLLISMLIRLAIRGVALRDLERILGQGEPPAADLAEFQMLFEDEEKLPLLLIAARGERAGWARFLEAVDAGRVTPAGVRMLTGNAPDDQSYLGRAIEDTFPVTPELPRTPMFRYWTQLVEAAKLPVEQQQQAIDAIPSPPVHWLGGGDKMGLAFCRGQATLRCAIVMLAAERFRQERGAWPNSLDELCPTYLKAVPKDPFDGSPLRYKRLADSVVIYSIGKKRSDGGGKLFRPGQGQPDNFDLGFQLWDPDKRRQPPMEN
jgi:hypothetical protein